MSVYDEVLVSVPEKKDFFLESGKKIKKVTHYFESKVEYQRRKGDST